MTCNKLAWCLGLLFAASSCFGQYSPVPLINQPLIPAAITPGGPTFMLTVNGTNFVLGSQVYWNGSPRASVVVSATKLTAMIPQSDIATEGTASVIVVNPMPGGRASNVVFFPVTFGSASLSFIKRDFPVGVGPCCIVAADFNGDTKLDVAVGNTDLNTISVLLGNGDGTFQEHVDYSTILSPTSLALGDFNSDGNIDLAVAVSEGGYWVEILLLLGNGNGTFQAAQVGYQDNISMIRSIAAGDLNGDGILDLGATYKDGFTQTIVGVGDGTLQSAVTISSMDGSNSITVGDFNNDGKLDLSDTGFGRVTVWPGYGAMGQLQHFIRYELGGDPLGIVAGDLNGDNKLDVAVVNNDTVTGNLSILFGQGDGSFHAGNIYAVGRGATAVSLSDLNGDGFVDLATTNYSENTVSILLGFGDGTFKPTVNFDTGPGPYAIAIGDFNADGRLDLVTANQDNHQGTTISLLLQNPMYKAVVQQPINSDGRSTFKANRGVVPVKFALIQNGTITCTLPPASFGVTRTAGGTLGSTDESIYSMQADSGSGFRIDQTACQYIYNLAASSLGVGTYRVDIVIGGNPVGHAVFALQ